MLNKIPGKDALKEALEFRLMIDFITKKHQKDAPLLLKNFFDLTPYEIKNLQYKDYHIQRLRNYCKRHNYRPQINFNQPTGVHHDIHERFSN